MSRIAKMPVKLPQGVNATLAADAVTVKGAKGALTLKLADGVSVAQQDQTLVVVIAEGKATNERIAAAGATRAQPREHGRRASPRASSASSSWSASATARRCRART